VDGVNLEARGCDESRFEGGGTKEEPEGQKIINHGSIGCKNGLTPCSSRRRQG